MLKEFCAQPSLFYKESRVEPNVLVFAMYQEAMSGRKPEDLDYLRAILQQMRCVYRFENVFLGRKSVRPYVPTRCVTAREVAHTI
jgi:hypothetical protein